MDYGKSGSAGKAKGGKRGADKTAPGNGQSPYARPAPKPELIARLKAAAAARKAS